nr:LysR substrate-binding domain-containing protein [uncultured Cupriavidus sp.]
MDLRQLTSFIAVAEEGQLSKAAARLCLSQPPVSRHIQALEGDLGVRLFDRTAAGMELTQAGKTLLGDARNIETLIREAAAKVQRASKGELGRLSVGVYGSAIFGVVPQILKDFNALYPDVETVTHYAQTPAQVQALRLGQVQIVFERLMPAESDINVELVCKEELLVAINESHPLAGADRVRIEDLRSETFIFGSDLTAASQVIELCKRAGFTPNVASSSSNVVTATLLAATGAGVTLVPESMVNVRFPGVRYLRLDSPERQSMDLYCFYLNKELEPVVSNMLEVSRTFAEKHRNSGG